MLLQGGRVKIIGNLSWIQFFVGFVLFVSQVQADSVPVHQRTGKRNTSVEVEIILNQDIAVVDERVPYKIRITHDPQVTEVVRVIPSEFRDGIMEELVGPLKMHKKIDGVMCMVYEFTGVFYPRVAGTVYLPSIQVEYRKREIHHQRSLFGLFSTFNHSANNVIHKDGPSLSVSSLAPYKGQVAQAVGRFSEVVLTLDKDEMKKGDAAILRYHVQGTGNIRILEHPPLILPQGLKGYRSETRLQSDGKVFEYVVQAERTGNFHIPVQEFLFFDTKTRSYQTLISNACAVHVERASVTSAVEDDLAREQELLEQTAVVEEVVESVIVPPSVMRLYALPMKLFWLFIFVMLCVPLAVACTLSMQVWYLRVVSRWKKKKLLRRARALLKCTDVELRSERLYEVFKKLQTGVNWDSDSQMYHSWNSFWGLLVEARFGKYFAWDDREFTKQTEQWIHFFEKKVG